MARTINAAGIDLITAAEGTRLTAYRDSVGVWTIGTGHTGLVNGQRIRKGLTIHPDHAALLLRADLEEFCAGVEAACPVATDNQFAAMVSLAFNVGLGAFRTSTVRRQHLVGNYPAAADAFRLFCKAGGRVLRGLKLRRERERHLYLTPDLT